MRNLLKAHLSMAAAIALTACGQGGEEADSSVNGSGENAGPVEAADISVSDPNCQVLTRWPRAETAPVIVDPIVNEIALDAEGQSFWNEEPVSPQVIGQYLEIVASMNPVPTTRLLLTESTSCEDATRMAEMIEEVVECGPGACMAEIRATGDTQPSG